MERNTWVNGDFTFCMKDHPLFKKDENNYIYSLGAEQLNTIGNMSLLDIFLMKDNSVEFHYHPNASEVIYCVTGEVKAGFINPNDNEWQHFSLQPGEVLSFPQGFWHYVGASKDDTHMLATFDTDNLQTVFGSDILRKTPTELMAEVYCLDEEMVEMALAPIDETVIIGPPKDCDKKNAGTMKDGMEMKRPSMMGRAPMKQERMRPEAKSSVRDRMEQSKRHDKQMQKGAVYRPKDQTPMRYGGTVVREMNVCEACMKEWSR